MYLLLIILSLVHITTCSLHTVIIDHHYHSNTTCHNCHNLQYYLLNTTKYFTSNTQFFFLPGIHYLHANLIIQNVHNFSLIGSKETILPTIIQCNKYLSQIVINNVSQLTLKDITIDVKNSKMSHYLPGWAPLAIKDCSVVLLHNLQIYLVKLFKKRLALVAINIMGNSYCNQIICNDRMELLYNETQTDRKHHVLTINDLTIISALKINMIQNHYKVTLRITNMDLQGIITKVNPTINDSLIQAELGRNEVLMINCHFIGKIYENYLL